jgi:hypothetical protein
MVALITDSLYPATIINTALKEAYGNDKSILDFTCAMSIGTRIGIPLATIRHPSLCLFINKNGIGDRSHDSGKFLFVRNFNRNTKILERESYVVSPSDHSAKFSVWEMYV